VDSASAAPILFGAAVLAGTASTVVIVPYSKEVTLEPSVFMPT
jgi:hypothetical protein